MPTTERGLVVVGGEVGDRVGDGTDVVQRTGGEGATKLQEAGVRTNLGRDATSLEVRRADITVAIEERDCPGSLVVVLVASVRLALRVGLPVHERVLIVRPLGRELLLDRRSRVSLHAIPRSLQLVELVLVPVPQRLGVAHVEVHQLGQRRPHRHLGDGGRTSLDVLRHGTHRIGVCPRDEATLQPLACPVVLPGEGDHHLLELGRRQRDAELTQSTDKLVEVQTRRRGDGIERGLRLGCELDLHRLEAHGRFVVRLDLVRLVAEQVLVDGVGHLDRIGLCLELGVDELLLVVLPQPHHAPTHRGHHPHLEATTAQHRGVSCGERALGIEVGVRAGNLGDEDVLDAVLDEELGVLGDDEAILERLDPLHHVVSLLPLEERSHSRVAVGALAEQRHVERHQELVGLVDGVGVQFQVAVLVELLVREPQVTVLAVGPLEEAALIGGELAGGGHLADLAEGQIPVLGVGEVPRTQQRQLHITDGFAGALVALPHDAVLGEPRDARDLHRLDNLLAVLSWVAVLVGEAVAGLLERDLPLLEEAVDLRLVGQGLATVRVDGVERRATEVAELLQPAGSIPLCVVQQLVGLCQLVLRDATEPGHPRCDVGHGEVGDDGQLLVERVLDLHRQTTRLAEQPLQSRQAGVLPGAEVEQAEDLGLEPVPAILPVADDPLGGLPCLGEAARHPAHAVVEQAGGEVVAAQVARHGEAADVVRVLPGLKRMDFRDDILHGEHRRPTGAGVLTCMVDPVPCSLVAELDPEAVECALDGVPHPVDDADVQGCGEVRQVLLDSLRLGQVTEVLLDSLRLGHATGLHGGIHSGIHSLLHAGAALVDVEHHLVEVRLRDEAAQTDVADGLVRQSKPQLPFSQMTI